MRWWCARTVRCAGTAACAATTGSRRRRRSSRDASGSSSRDEIELPLRGSALRDRYVLRLIAVDRAIHVIVLSGLAIVLFTFAAHDQALHHDYQNIMNDLAGGAPGASQARGVLGYLGRAFKYSPTHLRILALVLLAFAALEAAEMVGLWLNKRWAEYLTFIATTVLVPFEVYELTNGVSAFKLIALVINLAVVIYLLLAKRLFGLRGGHRAEQARARALERLGGHRAGDAAGARARLTVRRAPPP